MSQKASAPVIGAFVLGAIALLVSALLLFGSGRFLKDTQIFVLYFQENAKGLNVGAPVSFQGVKIGSVTSMQLLFDRSTDNVYVGVVIEIDKDAFHEIESKPGVNRAAGEDEIKYLIDNLGLRAQLGMLSLVTGQLYIEFGFYPDTEARLYGFDFHAEEFPTLPSSMEELQNAMQSLLRMVRERPLGEMVDKLAAAIDSISGFLGSQALKEAPELFNQTLASVRDLSLNLDQEVRYLTDSLKRSQALKEAPELFNQTLVSVRDLSTHLDKEISALIHSLQQATASAGAAIADLRIMMREEESGEVARLAGRLEQAADQANILLGQSREVVSSIDTNALKAMVRELSGAARSIRGLADYLDRHPEALIRGKSR